MRKQVLDDAGENILTYLRLFDNKVITRTIAIILLLCYDVTYFTAYPFKMN